MVRTAQKETFHQVGKRKTAVARVYLSARAGAAGAIKVNERAFEEYFPRESHRIQILKPFELTANLGNYDVNVNVKGGGISGQAIAVRHGISRALLKVNAADRPVLKKAGLLTRDARKVERKKYGMSGARKRYQYSKR